MIPFDVIDLIKIVPDVAIVIIFVWFSNKINESHLKAMQDQANMFTTLLKETEEGERRERELERAERGREAAAFRESLRIATEQFTRTIESMSSKWGKEIEELTLEVKTLTRFMMYLAGRLGGPTLEEITKNEEDKEKKARR